MYDKLPLDYIGITGLFGERIDPISGAKTIHYAVDLGWKEKAGEPIYAASNATVVLEAFDPNLGNYIVLSEAKGSNTVIQRYCHMKERALVKKDAKVTRGKKIGYMGTTGYSTGVHLHFEYWICPKSYSYNFADRPKYAVDPLKYCYLFPDQKASDSSISKVKKVVGKPVAENKTKSQIKVVKSGLNCRQSGSLSATILGYIDLGYYNVISKTNKDKYDWYQVETNKWVADVDKSIEIHLIEKPVEPPEPNPCQDLEDQIKELNNKIKEQEKVIEDLKNQNFNNNYDSFVAPKDANYYIFLKAEETIYFPK